MSKRWVGCPIETDYFGEERKRDKQARKMASAKDRSKYKKTDQRKQAKQPKAARDVGSSECGRVVSLSHGIVVDIDGENVICTLRGALKKERSQAKNLVVVGDFVLFEREEKAEEGIIFHVEPRNTMLSRADNLSRRKEQFIAANVDQAMITVSVVSPPLKPFLVDRYIIAAQKGGLRPIVVVNKIDLLQSEESLQERENEKMLFEEMVRAYKIAGIPLIGVSALHEEELSTLKEFMKDKTSVFSGQSGVGKSSLINAITGSSLRVGALVDKTKKGTHTTSNAQLLRLDFGGWCVDTPGIKSFGVWDLNREEIEHYFPEIFECGHECHFPDCTHFIEDDCAVKRAVEQGNISPLRYNSYLGLMESIQENHLRR